MANGKIKRSKDGYLYSVSLNKLTEGELMALVRALRFYNSPVGNDVLAYIRNAAYEFGSETYSKLEGFIRDVDMAVEKENNKIAEKV